MSIKRDELGRFIKGARNVSWKGGRNYIDGYIRVWKPDHPNNNGGYVLEHRLVVEKRLGRYLKKNETVHHINGVRDDNISENLIVMTRQVHPSQVHLKGKKRPKSVKRKISKKLMGHKVTDRTRKAVSKSNRKRYASGEKFGFQKGNSYGK